MQNTDTVTFDGKEITITELSVKQIRQMFDQLDKQEPQLFDDLINEPVPTLAITISTGITLDKLEEHRPSEVAALAKEVIAVNPFLAAMITRRVAAFEKIAEMSRQHSTDASAN